MIECQEGLLLEEDVEWQVWEEGSGKGDVEIEEGELWDCPVGRFF